ncbi:M67 family metallopeptidase [Sanyastnella coralliicola]|uniref:M67 family metallopeptidase n=1 Tax=Sanyastnella coralliicola TaxID=3069118 RepID=UPI0027B8E42D|nr:M67 family metallopeptidase [Longitalea sp. SCSIO 12813]
MKKLELTTQAEDLMKIHSLQGFPNEICGFFYGKTVEGVKHVTAIKPVENAKEGDQRRRFAIDPLDYMKAEQFAIAEELEFLGIYHTHPLHPAIPSEHDLKQALPSFSYIILSVQPEAVVDITSWTLNDDRAFEQEEIISNRNVNTSASKAS